MSTPPAVGTNISMRWPVDVLVVAAFALLLAACGGGVDVVDVGAAPSRGARVTAATPPPTAGAGDEAARTPPTGAAGAPGDAGAAGQAPDPVQPGVPGGVGSEDPASTPSTILMVYLTQDERVAAVPRSVVRVPRIGAAVLESLLTGPTPNERSAGYGTEIPPATRLRGLTITDGVAIVDLSSDFEAGGGTLGLTLRLAQVACTLDQFPTVDGVRFALDGTVVDVFSGDGLIIDEPVACSDYADVVVN